ncbi:MAG: hypothetical protein PHN32_04855 [Actinomycetota bacterium]|jgi:competence protein ComGC|nr:hypothetical protein [Actinomycetota bacterium]
MKGDNKEKRGLTFWEKASIFIILILIITILVLIFFDQIVEYLHILKAWYESG